jgi:hypothetical protein
MSAAVRHKNLTYVNISPAKHTWQIIEAFGFTPFCEGLFTAFPALGKPVRGVQVTEVGSANLAALARLPEHDLLLAHAGYGWTTIVCSGPDGDYPFVLQPFQRWRGRLSGMRLIYCRDIGDFVRFAGPIGRYLLRRRIPWVALDASGPVKGLAGVFLRTNGRKYFKGPNAPRLGDLAYTELALFGP